MCFLFQVFPNMTTVFLPSDGERRREFCVFATSTSTPTRTPWGTGHGCGVGDFFLDGEKWGMFLECVCSRVRACVTWVGTKCFILIVRVLVIPSHFFFEISFQYCNLKEALVYFQKRHSHVFRFVCIRHHLSKNGWG